MLTMLLAMLFEETEQCSCQVLASTFNVRIAAIGSGENSSNEGQLQKVYATQLAGCRREV